MPHKGGSEAKQSKATDRQTERIHRRHTGRQAYRHIMGETTAYRLVAVRMLRLRGATTCSVHSVPATIIGRSAVGSTTCCCSLVLLPTGAVVMLLLCAALSTMWPSLVCVCGGVAVLAIGQHSLDAESAGCGHARKEGHAWKASNEG